MISTRASASRTAEPMVADIVPNTARSLLALLEDRGLDTERVCRGLGFAPQTLLNQQQLLSHQQMRTLILRAYKALDDPAMGLAAGARQTPVSWGLPGLAMLTCETVGEAIGYGLAHQGQAGAMLEHRFEVTPREARLRVSARLFDTAIEAFLVEDAFAGAFAVARWLAGASFRPLRVELAYARPVYADAYRRLFHCPVQFGAAQHRFVLETHWLGARLAGYDRVTCSLIRQQLSPLLRRPLARSDIVESLSAQLRHSAEDAPRQVELAQSINLSERTLRRRLNASDTSFRALRDQARYERARDLLLHTPMTVTEVAQAVGYGEARAFRRAFKRWSGELPLSFRERIRGEPSGG